jgi:hypothetical protein
VLLQARGDSARFPIMGPGVLLFCTYSYGPGGVIKSRKEWTQRQLTNRVTGLPMPSVSRKRNGPNRSEKRGPGTGRSRRPGVSITASIRTS